MNVLCELRDEQERLREEYERESMLALLRELNAQPVLFLTADDVRFMRALRIVVD